MKRALVVAPLLLLFACQDPEVSGAADRSAKVSPLEASNKAPPGTSPRAPASGPAATAGAAANPSAPTSAPAQPAPPPKPAPSLFTCVKFPDGLTVIDSPEALSKLEREPLPMSEGCPDELPPSGINFQSLNLVLAQVSAKCVGVIRESPEGFEWSEWGDCERAQVLKASKLVAKAEAAKQKLTRVEPQPRDQPPQP